VKVRLSALRQFLQSKGKASLPSSIGFPHLFSAFSLSNAKEEAAFEAAFAKL
jgi:hypothetical protein